MAVDATSVNTRVWEDGSLDVSESRLLAALPHAGREESDDLLMALDLVGGREAVAVLSAMVRGDAAGYKADRGQALQTLAHLAGEKAVPVYIDALRSSSLFAQTLAMKMLNTYGDASAQSAVLAWAERRLPGRADRGAWDYVELPLAVRFFARFGGLAEFAVLLESLPAGSLPEDELRQLEVTWPEAARAAWVTQAEGPPVPDLDRLDDWFCWLPSTAPDDLGVWPSPESEDPEDAATRPPDAVVLQAAERALGRIEKRRTTQR